MVVSCAPGTAIWSALRRPECASKPTPVSVAPSPASAVIACVPDPARPVPCGRRGGPGGSRRRACRQRPDHDVLAAWRAVGAGRGEAAARRRQRGDPRWPRPGRPAGTGNSSSVQVVPAVGGDGGERDALAGRGGGGAVPRPPWSPLAATSVKLRAGRARQAAAAVTRTRSAGGRQPGRRRAVPAAPTAANPSPVAVTAFIAWLSPVAGRAMAARCQPVRPGAYQDGRDRAAARSAGARRSRTQPGPRRPR